MSLSKASTNAIYIFIVLLLVSIGFQNCTSDFALLSKSKNKITESESGGNGWGYEGKPDIYYRFLPDFQCEGHPAPVAEIKKDSNGNFELTTHRPEKCAAIKQSVNLVEAESFNSDMLGYRGGIFETQQSTFLDFNIFTEVWCQANTYDIAILYNNTYQTAQYRYHYLDSSAVTQVSMYIPINNRQLTSTSMSYTSDDFSLSIDRSTASPGVWWSHPAQFKGTVGNIPRNESVICRVLRTSKPSTPGAVTVGAIPSSYKQLTPTFLFTDSTDLGGGSISRYEIEVRKSSDNSLVKNYVAGTGNGTTGLIYDNGTDFLTGGESYFVNISAIDVAGNESDFVQSLAWTAIVCPGQFAKVPAQGPYTTLAFCTAKFEMKIQGQAIGNQVYNPAFVAESRPDGTPWVRLDRTQAINECQNMGAGYDLISNDQWQSIAQNIEVQNSNWTSNSIGTEMMYRGHSDDLPSNGLSVTDETDPYNQTGNTAAEAVTLGREQRRTHKLSNDEIFWDVAGNVWEWTKDDIGLSLGLDSAITSVTDITYPLVVAGRTARILFGPIGDYSAVTSAEVGAGLGHAWFSFNGGTITRGGDYFPNVDAGVFAVHFKYLPTDTNQLLGFRCIYTP
jgi:formylglycine-generating enzyme required for sulfatase activity